MKLLLNALVKFLCGVGLVGGLIFLPAGTLAYPNGWLFVGTLFLPILLLGILLLLKAPDLLKRRLDGKETQRTQKSVVALSALVFLAGFSVAGLDFRFGWSTVPTAAVIVATLLFLTAYGLYAEVMRENAYLARTVKVEEGQQVIDTGLYGIVRHPMYAATVLLFLMIPLILGSWYALLIFLAYPAVIVARIKNEEAVLTEQLAGYKEYKKKVRYRLIPFIW